MLRDFERLSSKLNAEKLLVIYKRYSQMPYGKLVGITVYHATENIAAMKQLGENVLGFVCLFHELQLLIEHVTSKRKELISLILSYTAEFHGSYDALIELSASTESSFSNLCQTRWCSIVEAIRYYLKWIKEIHAFLL